MGQEYRPITDTWILARPKVAYYGAYPNGFLERARVLLPVTRKEPVLHVCGGRVKDYPTWATLCPNDVTCDLNPAVAPDVVWNVRTNGIPYPNQFAQACVRELMSGRPDECGWRGMLIDRPYTGPDAYKYGEYFTEPLDPLSNAPLGQQVMDEIPDANQLIRDAMSVLCPGGRVGMLDYVWPQPPSKGVKSIACIGVIAGFNNRMRCFSVFEKR